MTLLMPLNKLGAACLLLVMSIFSIASAQAPAPVPAPTSSPSVPVTTYVVPEVLFKASPLPQWPQSAIAIEADLQAVLAAQASRTPSDTQEALLDAARGPLAWAQDAAGLGPTFTEQRYPAATTLLLALHEDMRAVNRAANLEKGYRVRPSGVDSRVKSIFADNLNNSASYPSARSASSRVWALLLGDVFNLRRAALLAHADRTAQLRLLGGAHFPSDIDAGKRLGDAYYSQVFADPSFQQALARARQEAAAAKP